MAGSSLPHPQVSVVIPTHNRSRLLRLTLGSALSQRGMEFEVIVVDDGSTDDTQRELEKIDDPRLRVLRHHRPEGVGAARNLGIAEARAAWVAFLDDDDLWAPHKLSRQWNILEETGRVWGYVGSVNITSDHRILGGEPPPSPGEVVAALPGANLVPGGCSGVMVTRRAVTEAGGFDPQLSPLADWDLWVRLGREGLPACVPRPFLAYRLHAGSMSVDTPEVMRELAIVERRYGIPVDMNAFYRYVARHALRMGWRRKALKYHLRAAATGDPEYLRREFLPAMWRLFSSPFRDSTAGRALRQSFRRPPRDQNTAWKDEARTWLDRFLREHDRERAPGR